MLFNLSYLTDKKYWTNKGRFGCSYCLLQYKLPKEKDAQGKIKVTSNNPMHVCTDDNCSFNICHNCFKNKLETKTTTRKDKKRRR